MNKTQCNYNNRNYITKPVAKRFADSLFFWSCFLQPAWSRMSTSEWTQAFDTCSVCAVKSIQHIKAAGMLISEHFLLTLPVNRIKWHKNSTLNIKSLCAPGLFALVLFYTYLIFMVLKKYFIILFLAVLQFAASAQRPMSTTGEKPGGILL